ncbi:MAG: HAD family hydrolase [Ruminococcaceae bacterium]|nr:HAD family hydrolase [Oscillospiraceae bacterium]
MRVFDFDNTIYDGESVIDFYIFSIKYNPRVIKYAFIVFYNALKYKLGKTTMESLEKVISRYAEGYLTSLPDINSIVKAFWDKNMKKIKPWYKPQSDDVILTASFNVTMDEAFRRLGLEKSVCSVFDMDTMKTVYLNFSDNKPARFRQLFGENVFPDEFYTDSEFDTPMIDISKSAYVVKKNKITRIK